MGVMKITTTNPIARAAAAVLILLLQLLQPAFGEQAQASSHRLETQLLLPPDPLARFVTGYPATSNMQQAQFAALVLALKSKQLDTALQQALSKAGFQLSASAVTQLREKISAQRSTQLPSLVTLQISDTEAELATVTLQIMPALLLKQMLRSELQQLDGQIGFLQQALQELEQNLRRTEQRIARFYQQNDLLISSSQLSGSDSAMNPATSVASEIRPAVWAELQDLLRGYPPKQQQYDQLMHRQHILQLYRQQLDATLRH